MSFNYGYLKPKYENRVRLLSTDTDSFMLRIETDDFYTDIADEVLALYDTSNFSEDHPSGISTGVNKKSMLV